MDGDLQYLINLTWPWIIGGALLRVFCWQLGQSLKCIDIGFGG